MYLLRLDDASEFIHIENWNRMETLLDRFQIKPIVGIIPNNQDSELTHTYPNNPHFWTTIVLRWQAKGWTLALHGYDHCYCTKQGGANPIHARSEFAGLSLEEQCLKIRNGIKAFSTNGIAPKIFFAPSHTFDANTLKALRAESQIRVISDTIANDIYYKDGFYFIPQQAGQVRNLNLKIVTFCYHPNTMRDIDYAKLEAFLEKNMLFFGGYSDSLLKKRNKDILDTVLDWAYFAKRKIAKK